MSVTEQNVQPLAPAKVIAVPPADEITLIIDDGLPNSVIRFQEPQGSDEKQSTAVTVIPTGSLTLWGTVRPLPPPDSFVYDAELERREYSRALIPAKDLADLDEDIKNNGFKPISWVRDTIRDNIVKESMDARGETYAIDPEIMIAIDTRTNYKVFIAGDNVYTREELYAHLPFHDLNVEPEDVFVQQEIGIFPARKYAMDEDEFEYVARDLGDDTIEFITIEDMVGQVTRKNYKAKRAPVKIVKTKIFLGKEKWDDFCLVHRVAKGVVNISGGKATTPIFAAMLGASQVRPMLMNEEIIKEQQRKMEEALKKREQEAKEREEATRRREEEMRKVEQKLQADVARIEAMLATMKKVNSDTARATRRYKPPPAMSTTEEAASVSPMVPDDEFLDDAELRETIRKVEVRPLSAANCTTTGDEASSSVDDDSVPLE